jgi:asparagine synthase (glutamine-hydrolysing)
LSGIVGIVNLDGAPVDRKLLRRMTDFLAFRGPDAQEVWADGSVGFGHAMLRTTFEAERERQPCSLDGDVWITADARIDARPELKSELEAAGRANVKDATDVELILHAWHAWGDDCVRHLLGDFAFAIWDGPRRRLFCARDHFGVRSFFYARAGTSLVFSNTLDCVRLHPAVSSRLNELAIADFLLFGWNQEPDTTTFAGISTLAPAHCLRAGASAVAASRYWQLPLGRVSYRREADYADRFLELLTGSVRDRLRSNRVSVSMSGGVDSSLVAAAARRLLAEQQPSRAIRAATCVFDRIMPDEERHWSGLVAAHLDIPIDYLAADGHHLFERWEELPTPEPLDHEFWARSHDLFALLGRDRRVTLTGEGGDACLRPSRSILQFLGDGHRLRLAGSVLGHWFSHGRLVGLGVRTWARRALGARPDPGRLPSWIARDLTTRLDLEARWRDLSPRQRPATGYDALTSPFWPRSLFPSYDTAVNRVLLEARHPFFDVRLLSFVLTVPPVPWLLDKELLRTATAGWLPAAIRSRPKSLLAGDPLVHWLKVTPPQVLMPEGMLDNCRQFIDSEAFRAIILTNPAGAASENEGLTRPLSLSRWLHNEAHARS